LLAVAAEAEQVLMPPQTVAVVVREVFVLALEYQ
jgi:hypothetical protein